MKKTSSYHRIISCSSQFTQHDLTDLPVKPNRMIREEKKLPVDTPFLGMPAKDIASEKMNSFITLFDTSPQLSNGIFAIEMYKLELQIKDQNKVFNKAAAKYNRLEKKDKNLQKKKISIEGEIQKNKHRLHVGIIEVEAKRQQLALSFHQRDDHKKHQESIIEVY